jgi:hypothetical protein
LIRRSYIDEVGASWDGPGIVCHEYGHQFVDDEIVAAARQRGVWQMALGSIVEHLHPYWNKADDDDIYRKGRETMDADRATFEARAAKFEALPTHDCSQGPHVRAARERKARQIEGAV